MPGNSFLFSDWRDAHWTETLNAKTFLWWDCKTVGSTVSAPNSTCEGRELEVEAEIWLDDCDGDFATFFFEKLCLPWLPIDGDHHGALRCPGTSRRYFQKTPEAWVRGTLSVSLRTYFSLSNQRQNFASPSLPSFTHELSSMFPSVLWKCVFMSSCSIK